MTTAEPSTTLYKVVRNHLIIKSMSNSTKVRRVRSREPRLINAVIASIVVLTIIGACMLSACNVTRTITTKSEYFKSGDTTCTIVTKTTETYDAKKNGVY